MSSAAPPLSRYQLKPGPYSSHGLVLAQFPERGDGRHVLDVGCAEGYLSEILASRGYAVTGIDRPGTPHPACVEFVGANLDRGLPPLAGPFDFILCADVIEHVREPLELLRALRNLMAPGASLIGSLPNSGHAWFRWNVLLGRFPQDERGLFDRTHLHFYSWRGWLKLFRCAGLRIVAVQSSAVPIGLAIPRWHGTAAARALEWMSFASARVWKTMFAYQFVVRAVAEPAAQSHGTTHR